MEDWLADYKDSCRINLGESGMPDLTAAELCSVCDEDFASLGGIILKDHDTRGSERLRNAIADSYDCDVPFEHVTVTTGTSEALFILFNLFLDRGQSAVVPMPSFQALYDVPRAIGAEIRPYTVDFTNRFRPAPDEICSLIDDSTSVVVLNSPHNPSGIILPADTVTAVVECARCHGATVISDEHYRFLPHDRPAPLKTLASSDGAVIATGSITKCFGVIGLRVGWIAAPSELITQIRDFRDYLTHTLSPLSDRLAAIALENRSRFMKKSITTLKKNRDRLCEMIDCCPGLSIEAPEGGIVAFPRYKIDLSCDDFTRGLLETHGIFVLPGSSFEMEKSFRVNMGQEPPVFSEAMDCIAEYYKSLADCQ